VKQSIQFFLLLLVVCSFTHSQQIDIRGIVTDSTTGERIPFVSVTIIGKTIGTTTNANGFYLLAGLESGTYDIQFSMVGYRKKIVRTTVRPNVPSVVNVRLVSSAVQLGEVVVEEESLDKRREVSTSLHIMIPEELQKIPVAVQGDLLRALQVLPGIVSTSDMNAKFYVRGGAGDQNLILLDGMKIYNPFHAFGVFSIFDPDLINATEIYTGAFPAGFGNRLSSVINITTRSGNNTRVSGTVDINSMYSKLQLEGPVMNNVNAILHFRRSIFKDAFQSFLQEDVPLSFYDGFSKVTIEMNENVRYTVQYFFSGDDLKGSRAVDANYKWRNKSFATNLSTLITDRLFMQSMIYQNSFITSRETSNNPLLSPATSEIKELGLKAFFTLYSESQSQYHFGFEFSVPEFTNKFRNGANFQVELSGSALDLSMWLRYEVNGALFKYDIGLHAVPVLATHYGFSPKVVQPRINVSYALNDKMLMKLSYGKFSQNVITLNNEEDVISLFESWTSIPEDIAPSTSDHYVAGIDYHIFSGTMVTTQVYYKTYSSLALYNRNKMSVNEPDYRSGKGFSRGVEFLLRHRMNWFELFGAYTLGWTQVTVDQFTYAPRYDRRHVLNITGTVLPTTDFEFNVRWELGSGLPFTQTTGFYDRLLLPDPIRTPYYNETGRPIATLGSPNAARLPVYHRLDVGMYYSHKFSEQIKMKAGITIINAYNQKNILYFDRYTTETIYMLPFFPSATAKVEF